MSSLPSPGKRVSLNSHLYHNAKVPDALRHLIRSIADAAKYIQFSIRTTEAGLAGSINQFGEEQVKLDVLSDQYIEHELIDSGLVNSYISEEHDEVVSVNPSAEYSVAFDPLDGSSLVDANFAIGSIFGIYKTTDILGKTPREQVAALYTLYGPRTLLVYSAGNGVHEFILNEVGEFSLLRENLGVSNTAKTFSPGNISAVIDSVEYRKAVDTWMNEKYGLRYSGCMVADIHHILSKGQGVFTNIGGNKYPQGKLRLVFECGPFAYLMEQAGGTASNGTTAILDTKIETVDQRTPIIIGSTEEVQKVAAILRG